MPNQSLSERSEHARTPARVSVDDSVAAMIDRQKLQIDRALPRGLSPDRFARMLVTEIKTKPALMKCNQNSLMAAVMKAASLGLEVGPLDHVYLVPRGTEVTMQIGYKGIIELARRSGEISELYAYPVYEGDTFHYTLGLHRSIVHEPAKDTERGKVVAAYAVAKYRDGGSDFEVLDEIDLEARRMRSDAGRKDTGPWKTDYAAMARKSAIRALAHRLPMRAEAAIALQQDERVWSMADLDEPADVIDVGAVEHRPELPDGVDPETGELFEASEQ